MGREKEQMGGTSKELTDDCHLTCIRTSVTLVRLSSV